MTPIARPLLFALALAVPATFAHAKDSAPAGLCKQGTRDSVPTSLGADGWAAVDGSVTGGCGATPSRIHHVYNRGQLVDALTKGGGAAPTNVHGRPRRDEKPKIIYVHGTVDLNVDDRLVPLKEEDYMRMCDYTAHETFYDPVTHNQTGTGGFFGAYKAAYDPNLWIRQSLDPSAGVDRTARGSPPLLPAEASRARRRRRRLEHIDHRGGRGCQDH